MIECVAADSADVENVACPELRLPVPSVAAPSLNVTVPVATEGVTVAVKVTDWLSVDGFSEEVNEVELAACVTIWETTADVLVAVVASPA